jgi:hypothetical protein
VDGVHYREVLEDELWKIVTPETDQSFEASLQAWCEKVKMRCHQFSRMDRGEIRRYWRFSQRLDPKPT